MSKFKPEDSSQLWLLPPSIDEFVDKNHLARVVSEVVDFLDVTEIEDKYSHLGQKSYSPKLILRLLFYGYATGIRSGRKIAALCETDTAYMFLSNMLKPNFRTINDFRKENIHFIKDAFIQVVRLSQSLGMAKVGTITMDGTKLKANANKSNSKTKKGYHKWLKKVESEIDQILEEASEIDDNEDDEYGHDNRGDQIPKELEQKEKLREKIKQALSEFKADSEKERVNLTDTDAKIIKGNGSFNTNYNCQAAISEDEIIVACYTSNNSSDKKETIPLLESVEENTLKDVNQILADAGYSSYDNYESLESRNIVCYIPDQEWKSEVKKSQNPYHKSHFIYNKDQDSFCCPEGKKLTYRYRYNDSRTKQRGKVYRCNECMMCDKKPLCTKAKQRSINKEDRETLRNTIRVRLSNKIGKSIYHKRMKIEAVFGDIKHNLNFKHLFLKGLEKTTAEWQLICIGHNIRKIHLNKIKNLT